MKWKTPVERLCITMLICIFHWFATSAKIDTGGGERGGGGGGCSSNGWLVHCLDLTSHNNLFSTQTFQKSVSILCSYCSLLSANLRHTLCFFKIRLSSRWWILFKFCSEIRHCRSNERSFWSFRRFDGFHAVTVTIAEVHKKTYGKPKVIKSIVKTEQDNKTVSYKIFSKCRIRISLNGGC